MTPAIVISAFTRPKSIKQLLKSLDCSDYSIHAWYNTNPILTANNLIPKLFSTSIDKLILFHNCQTGATITPNTFGKYLYTFIGFQKEYANYTIRKISKLLHYLLKKANKGSLL